MEEEWRLFGAGVDCVVEGEHWVPFDAGGGVKVGCLRHRVQEWGGGGDGVKGRLFLNALQGGCAGKSGGKSE